MPSPKIISSQKTLASALNQLTLLTQDFEKFWQFLEGEILIHKVKFPVLEYLAVQLNDWFEEEAIETLLQRLAAARHISCYPIIGKLLQLELSQNLSSTYEKAIGHIIIGNEWYACDIISERVFGEGTLKYFEQSFLLMKEMGHHENFWIQRSIGIATHYATKKKLPKESVEALLLLMISHGHKTQYFIKKGIGWAGKTIARHHNDLIRKHEVHMKTTPLSRWFVSKVNIGLSMAQAAPFVYE